MKKILVLFALAAITMVSVNAQGNVKWGLMAGMNSSKYTITGFDSKIGFHAGVKADVALSQEASGAYLDFAALLTLKGAKIDAGPEGSITFNPYYLEVPIRIGYKYAVTEDFSIFGGVGPYVAVGLFGKATVKAFTDGIGLNGNSASEDIFGKYGLDRLDLGVGLKGGVEFSKQYQVAVSYDFGLIEVVDGTGMKNRNLMISFGYLF